MSEIRFIFYILFVSLAAGCNSNKEPNIVLIIGDDLGWKDVSYNDNPYFETPNVDLLAKESMVFTNAYSNAPNCAPSRASIMTGLYSPRTGIYTVNNSERGKTQNRRLIPTPNTTVLDTGFVTIAEVLKEHGYVTGHFGKWHLGEGSFGPEGQGFDVNRGGHSAGAPKSYFSPYNNPALEDGPVGEHITDRLAAEAVDFIKENKSDPFFLYFPMYSVHTPIQAKPDLIEKYKERDSPLKQSDPRYGAMVEVMDMAVGTVINELKSQGIYENTVIIFMSDNGPYYPVSSAEPLKGSKGMMFEGGIRIPFLIKENKTQAGSSKEPVIGLDIFPTLLQLAGIPQENWPALDGRSVVPAMRGEPMIERSLFWHFPAYLGGYKGMETWRTTPATAIRQGNWKMIEYYEDTTFHLYNLKDDIGEKNNVVADYPAVAERLWANLSTWRLETNAPVPRQLNPEYVSPVDSLSSN